MEEILVTGGMGYIGSHSCVALQQAGFSPVIVDNLSNSSPRVLEGIAAITGEQPRFYELDVCDEGALLEVFAAHSFAAVIHFAGFKAVAESKARPLDYYRNNLDGTMSLLRCMERSGVQTLIFSSSATVYDTLHNEQLPEDCPRWCAQPYGWSKFMSEQIIRDYAAANPAFRTLLLRYFNPVGAHESGHLGEAPSGVPQNLMPFLAQVAVGERPALTIFGDDYNTPDGSCVRDYIHVCDLAEGHLAALRYAQANEGCLAVNLGRGQGVSVFELVSAFEQANGLHIPRSIGPRRAGDTPAYYATTDRAEQLLGWRATRSIEDMCRTAYHWEQKRRALLSQSPPQKQRRQAAVTKEHTEHGCNMVGDHLSGQDRAAR